MNNNGICFSLVYPVIKHLSLFSTAVSVPKKLRLKVIYPGSGKVAQQGQQ